MSPALLASATWWLTSSPAVTRVASTTWWLSSSPAVTGVLASQASNNPPRTSMGGDSVRLRSALAASAASPDSVWAASATFKAWRLSPMSGSRR